MEKSDQDNSAHYDDRKEESTEKTLERIDEYQFFVSKDTRSNGQGLISKETKDGEKGVNEADLSVTFFLSD